MSEYCPKTGKVKYPSRGDAARQMRAMQRETRRRRRKMEHLNSYQCTACGHWHVGNLAKGVSRHG